MKRRDFITLVGGAALAWRFRVTFRIGQQDANPPHLMGLLRAGRERV